jgi:glycosyltransferase involved in cell wall biosynthesis
MRSSGILIPAYNEAATVASVVEVALKAELGPVWVVDDGSEDDTSAVAERAGATVLRLDENHGKGGAVWAGAKVMDCEVVVLLDADLTGLTPQHIRALAEPVVQDEVVMSRGVFAGGRWSTAAAQRLAPQLNGQRAILRRALLEVENLSESRYGIEVAITHHAQEAGWTTRDVAMPGVSQVMKEEKRGFFRGFMVRLKMYAEILLTLARNAVRR